MTINEKRRRTQVAALSASSSRTGPMAYNRFDFAKALSKQLDSGYDELELSRWAYRLYLDHANHLEPGLYEEIMRIVAMEEGEQFHLTERDLRRMINDLATE